MGSFQSIASDESYELVISLPDAKANVERAKRNNDRGGEGQAWLDLGYAYCRLMQFSDALEPQAKASQIAKEIKSKDGELNANVLLGRIQEGLGRYEEALVSYQNALKIGRLIDDEVRVGILYLSISKIYRQLGEWDSAINTGKQAINRLRKDGQTDEETDALVSLALTHVKLESYDEAFVLIKAANNNHIRGVKEESKIVLKNQLETTTLLGDQYMLQSRISDASWCYHAALPLAQRLVDLDAQTRVYISMGSMAGTQGDITQAVDYFNKALEYSKKLGDMTLQKTVYQNLALANRQTSPPDLEAAKRYQLMAEKMQSHPMPI
eukprot:gb/GEZN01011452.1/.p1 GENE.gb/GEZN01011452.1/~~gb/GEZN01011452.1/.p1  ORF type:complete len:324 (-),score=42.78 gb/GEZN01011452.1/:152-1123(-)